ncbi:MAG: aromatic ring-hydroxylating dioxygenase subunit alpha [Pseudomonadota bacterium]
MKFLRNIWYVAAWSQEVAADTLLYRKIANEPVLLTRRQDGTPVAMSNVCPHRFAPLHLGCKKGDQIQCGYHGLEFDITNGKCVHNPNTPGTIPTQMVVPTFSVAEKHTMLWVWMGDEPADESLIPDFSVMADGDGMSRSRVHFTMNVNVESISNNLMDLSHGAFLHAGLLSVAEHADAEIKVTQEGRTVICERQTRDAPVPKMMDLLYRRDGKNVDFWNAMRWNPPSCFLIDVTVNAPGLSHAEGISFQGIHILSPETDSTTHYFVGAVRAPVSEGEQQFQQEITQLRMHAFKNQDEPMMEAMQEMLGVEQLITRKPVLMSVDAGPVRMKRILDELLAKEVAGRQPAKAIDDNTSYPAIAKKQ